MVKPNLGDVCVCVCVMEKHFCIVKALENRGHKGFSAAPQPPLNWMSCAPSQRHEHAAARHEEMYNDEVRSCMSIIVIVRLCVTTLKTVFKPV